LENNVSVIKFNQLILIKKNEHFNGKGRTMDLMSIAASIYAGLAKDFINFSVRSVRKKFEWPEREQAIDRCLKEGCEALVPVLKGVEKKEQKRLGKLLTRFFDDSDTVKELTVLLSGKELNREELGDIYEDIAGEEGNVPGFDLFEVIDYFESAFMTRAEQEQELLDILSFGEMQKQTGEMRKQAKSQKSIDKSLKKIANAKEDEKRRGEESARERYLESLTRECLNLPLSVLGEETTTDDELTLDAVYIDLDTTATMVVDEKGNKISDPKAIKNLKEKKSHPLKVRDAATEHKKLVLLGDPGAGKSTFVRELCALLARANLTGKAYPKGYTKGLLPVFIQLRDLAPKVAALKNIEELPGDRRKDVLIKTVHQQIEEDLKRLEAESFTESLRDALRRGECLLVLDGLDEVPFGQRDPIRKTVNAVISKYSPERVIVTCRIRSYTEHSRLGDFQEFTIASLNEKKIKKFIAAWYRAKKEMGKLDAEQERKRVDDLQRGALNLMALARNPMMLTTMAIIHYNKRQLPDERVKLYKLVVDILLRRWRRERLGEAGLKVSGALAKMLKDEKILNGLAARLGYEAHSTGKKNQETADIDRPKAVFILAEEGFLPDLEVAKEFLDYADQQSGLLVGRGGEYDKPVSYGFYHRTFQEYLAGCYIVSQRNIATEIMNLSKEGDYWAATVQFGFEELYYNEPRRGELTLKELAYQLCINSRPKTTAEARQIVWASNIAVLLTAESIEKDPQFPSGGKAYLERLRKALVSLLSGSLPFPERAEAGRNLAALGELESLNIQPLYSLRKEEANPDEDNVKAMLKRLGFFDSDWHKEGKGCIHIYQPQTISGGTVVPDYASGLMWQQAGSKESMVYKDAIKYIDRLNREAFAGFKDWRLPTLEEAMSLMESERNTDGLYIDAIFDETQRWIWTVDKHSASAAWGVYFYYGDCTHGDIGVDDTRVRAVRSGH
jgi:hypothetical protein